MQTEQACDNRVIRLILEHAVHLRMLNMVAGVDDIDAAFADVRIIAPLQTLGLINASDITINAIGQLGKSLTILIIDKCREITTAG